MNKSKKIISIVAAATLAVSAFALTGCNKKGYKGEDLTPGYDSAATVTSNGGFVVEKGNYLYFINGQEAYTAKNSYGKVVKGALMRLSKTELAKGNYDAAQIVVPSLFAAGDYDAGIYIYGDYVYYATPTTDKNNKGEVKNEYLDFKRARIDGKKAPMDGKDDYFLRLSSNSTKYRFVEVNGGVYCLYQEDGKLKSYNVDEGKTTVLVDGASSFYFDTENPDNPNVYYTMSVTYDLDTQNPTSQSYNQIYCVNAANTAKAKDGAYTVYGADGAEIANYAFDKAYLKDNDVDVNDYKEFPYVNLGQLVLDGVGSTDYVSQDVRFNPDLATSTPNQLFGYTYTIQQYTNDGIYFTRAGAKESSSSDTFLYYLAHDNAVAETWNTIEGNKSANLTTVAKDTTNASTSAVFGINADGSQYYYYASGDYLKKEFINASGEVESVRLADVESSVTLWKVEGDYLYYYDGGDLTRINVNYDDAEVYNPLLIGDAYKEYRPVVIPMVETGSWYDAEFVTDGDGNELLLYSNAKSYVTGGLTYNYVYAASVNSTEQLIARNEKLEEINDYIDAYDENEELQDAMRYYFATGEREAFDNVIDLYDSYQQKEFDIFVNKFAGDGEFVGALEENFIHLISRMTDDDIEDIEQEWVDSLLQEEEEEDDEKSGLPTWAIVLIVVGAVVVVAAAVTVPTVIILKKRAKKRKEEEIVSAYKRKKIDTTDDKSIDVYADEDEVEENAEAAEETPAENAETAEEPAAEEVAEVENAPVEE